MFEVNVLEFFLVFNFRVHRDTTTTTTTTTFTFTTHQNLFTMICQYHYPPTPLSNQYPYIGRESLFNICCHLEIVYSMKCQGKENKMLHYFSSYAISCLLYLQYLLSTITIHHSFLPYCSVEFHLFNIIICSCCMSPHR